MRKYALIATAIVALVGGAAVAVWAAYDVTGSSGGQAFTAGSAVNLSPDPDEADLNGILPGETRSVDVVVTNSNAVPVTVTNVDLGFNDSGVCDLTTTPWSGSFVLGAAASDTWVITVSMGDPDPGCEGWAGITVAATATGTMP